VASLWLFLNISWLFSVANLTSFSYFNMATLPADLPAPPLSLSSPPSLFPDKKFPVAEAHFWSDKLFYFIDNS
jgi:hypothetical protein